MSKNQTTALLLLVFTAFLFWLYNTGKLKTIVGIVKGSSATITTPATVDGSAPSGTLSPMPISNLGVQPYSGQYQLPSYTTGSGYTKPNNNGSNTLNNIGLSQSLFSIPTSDAGITPQSAGGYALGFYDVLNALGWSV